MVGFFSFRGGGGSKKHTGSSSSGRTDKENDYSHNYNNNNLAMSPSVASPTTSNAFTDSPNHNNNAANTMKAKNMKNDNPNRRRLFLSRRKKSNGEDSYENKSAKYDVKSFEFNNNDIDTNEHYHLPPNASNVVISTMENNNNNNLRVVTTPSTVNNHSLQTERMSNVTNGITNSPSSNSPPPVTILSSTSSSLSNQYHHSQNNNQQKISPNKNSNIVASNSSGNVATNRKLPGLFHLIEQNNWSKVIERCSKYPRECEKWVMMKRVKNKTISHHQQELQRHQPQDVGLNTSIPSTSLSADMTINIATIQGYTSVKCKALHHACHKLNSVHSYIKRQIAAELNDYDAFIRQKQQQYEDDSDKNNHRSCSSPSSCHLAAASSFDELITDKISPRLGQVVDCIKRNSPKSSSMLSKCNNSFSNDNNGNDEEWDDPWIEACKAIISLLNVYPEAAQQRETRHGCLPIHLAAFAMCPTPNAILPEEYIKYKYQYCPTRRDDNQQNHHYSNSSSFSFDEEKRGDSNILSSHKQQVVSASASAEHQDQYLSTISANDNDSQQAASLLPPRPDQMQKSRSNTSAASSSAGGFSSVLMERDAEYFGYGSELSNSMVSIEERLRSGKGGLTEEDEIKLLERCARPAAISDKNDRVSSTESAFSTFSTSMISNCSTVIMDDASPITKSESQDFYLDKYIANEKRRNEYSLKVINALLDAYQKGPAKDSEGGRLPLHTALAGRATFEVIDTLLKAYPYAARSRTKDGSLPLHFAAFYGVSHDEIAPTLLRQYPYATVGKNRFDRTPLEEALLLGGENGRKHQLKLLEALRRPEFYWNSTEQRKLLTPTNGGNNEEEACVDDNVEEDTDKNSLTSLIARQEWDIILDRMEEFTDMIQTPLHTAVKAGYVARVSVLHLVCERNPTYEVLDALVGICPEALTWKQSPGGGLPLHVATTWNASSSVIGYLLAANPQAAKKRDAIGNLPLHCACFSGASKEIIESLLCTNPLAVNVKNIQGSRPRDIVERLSHHNKKFVVELIERVSLEILQRQRTTIVDLESNYQSNNNDDPPTGNNHPQQAKVLDEEEDDTTNVWL